MLLKKKLKSSKLKKNHWLRAIWSESKSFLEYPYAFFSQINSLFIFYTCQTDMLNSESWKIPHTKNKNKIKNF
jgi:hypothetical protein